MESGSAYWYTRCWRRSISWPTPNKSQRSRAPKGGWSRLRSKRSTPQPGQWSRRSAIRSSRALRVPVPAAVNRPSYSPSATGHSSKGYSTWHSAKWKTTAPYGRSSTSRPMSRSQLARWTTSVRSISTCAQSPRRPVNRRAVCSYRCNPMPELPEVEFARGCLERWLGGEKLARVEADRGRVTRGTPLSAFEALAGHTVKRVERRGKWLLWHFEDGTGVLAHLGMTGKFEMTSADVAPRSSRVRFVRRDGVVVHYRDPRQFGRLQVAPMKELLGRDPLASLGPDAHEPPLGQVLLKERLGTRKRS